MTLKECLDNFVGLRGFCNDVEPTSGKFVNTLPGISLKMIANLSNEEASDFGVVWDDIYDFSLNELEGDILNRMQPHFKRNILVDHESIGFFKTPQTTEASSNDLKGLAIDILDSKNTEIRINHIQLHVGSGFSDSIFFYDYDSGTLLDSVAFTATAGLNTIQLNKTFSIGGQRTRIFIAWDGSKASTIETNTSKFFDPHFSSETVRGAKITKGTAVLKDNLSFDGLTHGMIVNFTILCSAQNFICNVRNLFAIAFWYKLGEALMNERLASERLNFFTLVNEERAIELRDFYKEKYENQLDSVLDNLEPEFDGLCFPCEKKRTFKVSLP